MDYKQLAIERFSDDLYATQTTRIKIEEVGENYAKCSLSINKKHMNAAGFVMGGAIFTLADFTFAIAANSTNVLTVSLTSQINYINATKGPVLYAEAKCVTNKKNICFYNIIVNDNKGNIVANVSTTGYRKSWTKYKKYLEFINLPKIKDIMNIKKDKSIFFNVKFALDLFNWYYEST